ncbi:MAG: DUF4173 domain-containing protein [Defluviitaleaceae bacterium]|nr:DUF4173 domain-containing protein [Defluviitaleaceae bacterium]
MDAGMLSQIELQVEPAKEKPIDNVEPLLKRKLLIYMLISIISFSFFVINQRAGVSVPIFVIIQAIGLYRIIPNKKYILTLVPIFIFALNSFISANPMWRVANLLIAALLYGVMGVWIVCGISLRDTSLAFLLRLIEVIYNAFSKFPIPFRWGREAKIGNTSTIKRIMMGIAFSIPALIFLIIMLSRADMIFFRAVTNFLDVLTGLVQFNVVWRILIGVFVGLYLFGIVYGILIHKDKEIVIVDKKIAGDCMVIGIILTSVLLVYTLFVAIQFRYLFAAPDNLPYGLTFVTYARRGFFELLFLTFVNIASILVAVWLTKSQSGRGAKFIKILCFYLCAVTVVLLVSSFYRMWLYGAGDGLTRLRLLVFGFLIFEGIGLIFTFFYIAKPKFNIVLVYGIIALSYYLLLNLVPIDRIIARDQINRYFTIGGGGIPYTLTLSPDAAPEIVRLLQSDNAQTQYAALAYFEAIETGRDWRQWNISINHALRLKADSITN